MTRAITAKIKVEKIKWNEKAVSEALARDPRINSTLQSKATAVAADARSNIGSRPKRSVTKVRWGKNNTYASEKPSAIAKLVSTKPVQVFPLGRGGSVPVALVVADHPYTKYYIDGLTAAIDSHAGGPWKRRRAK